MVMELQNGAIARQGDQESAAKHSSISGNCDQKLVALSSEQLKQIKEAAGLSANFSCDAVKEAFVEIPSTDQVTAVIEIFKNAKPAEVGLRYARDAWSTDDSVSSRLTVRTTYGAIANLENLRTLVRELAQLGTTNQPPVRINLKDCILSMPLAVDSEPVEAQRQEEVQANETTKNREEAIKMPLENATNTTTQSSSRGASSVEPVETAKYATYSRSEVDRMFKQQTEAITASLGTKINNQSKAFQEAIDEQQKAFNKSIDRLIGQVDEFRMKLEANAVTQKNATKDQLEHFSADLTKELEQFKSSLNKSIVPSIKTIDEKLRQINETSPAKNHATTGQSGANASNTGLLTALVCASLVASIISIVLQVVHH